MPEVNVDFSRYSCGYFDRSGSSRYRAGPIWACDLDCLAQNEQWNERIDSEFDAGRTISFVRQVRELVLTGTGLKGYYCCMNGKKMSDAGKESGGAKAESAHEHDDTCRCKETSRMSPKELLKLMMNDLAFWKKEKKN
ncbi:MAG: hypothetical protein M0042_12800 [Nitrospiraceae bacterium]|nr:hypothetical protein [Nitrospiraceae bacterium]